ncbi:MAG: hypothetical protein II126_00675, partial [Erysipelotrichaceae bacterium]|nr:hypothetical protein [Erysipelotrichaceae bacterium]
MNGRSRMDKYSNLRQGISNDEVKPTSPSSFENTAGFNTGAFNVNRNTDNTGSYRTFGERSSSFVSNSYAPNRYNSEDYDRLLKEQEDFLNSIDDHFKSNENIYDSLHVANENVPQNGPKYAAYDFEQRDFYNNPAISQQPAYQQP